MTSAPRPPGSSEAPAPDAVTAASGARRTDDIERTDLVRAEFRARCLLSAVLKLSPTVTPATAVSEPGNVGDVQGAAVPGNQSQP